VKKTRLSLSFAFVMAAMSLSACGTAHLSNQYAMSYAAWFNAQHAKAKPGAPEEARRIIESLDAQEAASVSKSYRRGVSRGGEEAPRLLTIGTRPGATGAETYMPPPSVPQ
jgi:cytochrome c